MKALLKLGAVIVAGIILITACKKDSTNNPSQAGLQVRMTDAPGEYDAVYVDVRDVMVSSSVDDGGWVSVSSVRPGIYNLMDLRNGVDTLLADGFVPAGRINQIRLILGTNNSVVKDGVTYPLSTPSAQQSGLKIKFQTDLVGGRIHLIMLDFDAGRSIVENGNGDFHLKPVIRAFIDSTTGVISGQLDPSVVANVSAISATDEGGTYSDLSGRFVIKGLKAGVYNVVITPTVASGLSMKTIEGVVVVEGQVKALGTISLP